jgi:D-alanyl-D-alanine dipeptidase
MNAHDYCTRVEQEDRRRGQRIPTVPIVDDKSPLVSLKVFACDLVYEPCIVEDYRYLVRDAVADKVIRISERLGRQDKQLIIRSVWRSAHHQRLLWDRHVDHLRRQNPEIHAREINEMAAYFIAPETKSMHATGGAVDALIHDRKSDRVMDFGTNDGLNIELGRRCYAGHPGISAHAKRNRRLLIDLFEEEGFVCEPMEFWHFDYGNVVWAIATNQTHAIYGPVATL